MLLNFDVSISVLAAFIWNVTRQKGKVMFF